MTIESPRGLKNNLKQNFGPEDLVSKNQFDAEEYGKNILKNEISAKHDSF